MKILSSDVYLFSKNKKVDFSYEKLQLKFIQNDKRSSNQNNGIKHTYIKLDTGKINLDKEEDITDIKTKIIKILIEKLTGKKIKTVSLKDILSPKNAENLSIPEFAAQLTYEKFSFKSQQVDFKAHGVIKTKSGREINFQLSFSLKKEQIDYSKVNIKSGSVALVDPLVINLNGDLQNILSDSRFEFDLDSDGKNEKIPFLSDGSGFIVFDKNQNGKIDNGAELFGASTGNGFYELSQFDTDKDGWIDEDDKYFNRLKVWLKNENSDRTVSFKELGIGAIYLSPVLTEFSFEDKGFLRKSSIYLKENGNVGIVSKIDFTV